MTPVLTPPLVGAAPFASYPPSAAAHAQKHGNPEITARHGDHAHAGAERTEQHTAHEHAHAPSAPATPEGLKHVDSVVLDARQYKSAAFAHEVLCLIGALRVRGWTHVTPAAHTHTKCTGPLAAPHTAAAHGPPALKIHKVSGSLTNAVFFISCAHPSSGSPPTVLLRIYGPCSSTLISRRLELHTLHVLSTRYGIGPRIYGTFGNGRVEEYFKSEALTSGTMRGGEVSRWVGRRMAELHCVDLGVVWGSGSGGEAGELESVRRNVRCWLGPAREVLALGRGRGRGLEGLDLRVFEEEWERYWVWLEGWEAGHGRSERVFAHNDAQYGNLLRLTGAGGRTEPAHHKIIVVDFEYAGPNAVAFDIANHFHEWMADYHGERPHELRVGRYPTLGERRNFYTAYLMERGRKGAGAGASEEELAALEAGVQAWSAASHGMWAVWGIVQAREQVEGGGDDDDDGGGGGGDVEDGVCEFDYLSYAASRMAMFRSAVAQCT